ncbi:MAG TPA: AAA family ATPase [Nocardioidaceae bacterium]|nr:AAA family ATPase [Nocardioidaceae bacterium]
MIEVKLLGPPRVERDGTLVAFDTRKAVALLAHLALSARPRPREALAELLWPDTDPERARGALRRTLSSLRSAVGPERLEATRDQVHLVKGEDLLIDVDVFRECRERHDLERALDVFRGDFLEGFSVRDAPPFEDWAQVEGEGLRRELVATLSDLAGSREAAGDRVGALRVVQRWLSLDPLDESAHRGLIRLYAEVGDRGAALTQYRECVRTLFHELGVPPLTETTELYEAINRGDFTASSSPAVVLPLPSREPVTPLVGRTQDLAALRAAYQEIRADGRVVWVEGEAGIGKTRLVEEFLSTLGAAEAHVLVGRAFEDEVGLAYAPVMEALRGRLRQDGDWVAEVEPRALHEAARLLPELLAGRTARLLSPVDDPGAETRFLSGMWETVAAAAQGPAPGVLFVDDVQWADDATVTLLSYGLRRLSRHPLLVVLASRTPTDSVLRRAVTSVRRDGTGMVIGLGRLPESAVDELVSITRSDETDPTVSRRLWAKTEGVPLLLVEYLRTQASDGDWPLPIGARDLLRARVGPVSEIARQVLAAAAVLGRSFDPSTVRAVSGRSEVETVAALEELQRWGLISEGSADYDFAHGLLRVFVYDETSLARRRLLHARAAELSGAPPAATARHLQLAGRDSEAALQFRTAGDRAREVFANADALAHLRTALALGHPDTLGLLTAIADVQIVMGDYDGAGLSLETAAQSSPSKVPAVELRLGRLRFRSGEYELAQQHLLSALASTPERDRAGRAEITADLSLATSAGGDDARALTLALEAKDLAAEADDLRALCSAHNIMGMLATVSGETDEALSQLNRSRELAEQVGDQALLVASLNNLALAHRARGELASAIELTGAALDLCHATGDRHHEAALHNNLADLVRASGDHDGAMSHLKTAVEIFADVGAAEQPRPGIWKLVRW